MASDYRDIETKAQKQPLMDYQTLRDLLPEFAQEMRQDRALLEQLNLQPRTRNLIDFGPAALAKLEAKAIRDFDIRRQLEMTARANFDAQAQAHALILSLLEARNHSDLARRLARESQERFGLVTAAIALEDTAPIPLGWMTLDYGGVDYIIGETEMSVLGPDGVCRALFGDDVRRIKSAAVIRTTMWRDGRPGAVAFGSADYEGFTPDMGAELVAFVTRVVERVAERWPIL